MQPATETVSDWLRKRCEQTGLSLRQVGAKAGLSHTTIAEVLNGKATPNPGTIKKLALAFGGNGQRRLVIEDRLLVLAGYRTRHPKPELSETMAHLLDKVEQLDEPQVKLLSHFVDFLVGIEAEP